MRIGAALGVGMFALASPAWADEDNVAVKMTGPPEAVLERVIEGTDLWESLCVGTCDAKLPLEGSYRINGPGMRPSAPLTLSPAGDGVVHLEAHPGYSSAFAGGILLTVLGPLVAVGGVLAIVSNNNNTSVDCPECGPQQGVTSNAPAIGGALSIGIGSLMTVMGIIILQASHHTTAFQSHVAVSPSGVRVSF